MTPGTLMIFAGRNSLHRVPDTDSSKLFKLVRYGRSEALTAG